MKWRAKFKYHLRGMCDQLLSLNSIEEIEAKTWDEAVEKLTNSPTNAERRLYTNIKIVPIYERLRVE